MKLLKSVKSPDEYLKIDTKQLEKAVGIIPIKEEKKVINNGRF